MKGVRNMLANESLFLPTVDLAIDFLAVAHKQIMPSKVIIIESPLGPVPYFSGKPTPGSCHLMRLIFPSVSTM